MLPDTHHTHSTHMFSTVFRTVADELKINESNNLKKKWKETAFDERINIYSFCVHILYF